MGTSYVKDKSPVVVLDNLNLVCIRVLCVLFVSLVALIPQSVLQGGTRRLDSKNKNIMSFISIACSHTGP